MIFFCTGLGYARFWALCREDIVNYGECIQVHDISGGLFFAFLIPTFIVVAATSFFIAYFLKLRKYGY